MRGNYHATAILHANFQRRSMSAEAEKEPVKPASQEPKSIPWSGILKAAAAIGTAVGGYLVHLSGSISHRNYVYEWGLDSGLFPLSTEATFIEGFYALIDRLAKIQTTIWSGGSRIAIAVVLLLTALLFARQWMDRKFANTSVPKPPAWVFKWPGDLLQSFMVSAIVVLALQLPIAVLILLMAGPAAFAETAGQEAARRELVKFQKGCDADVRMRCMELRKGSDVVAKGFLITSSPTHIAIYDVQMRAARALERGGTELRSEIKPAAPVAAKASAP